MNIEFRSFSPSLLLPSLLVFLAVSVPLAFVSLSAQAAGELARVNGKPITSRDLDLALGNLNEGQRENVLRDENSRRQILANLIDQELLAQEAEKEKLDQDQEYKDALAGFRKQYLSTHILQKTLAPKVTEAAAKKFFELNKSRYSTDQVHAQHIVVTDEARARQLLAEARKPSVDFQELAEKNSHDPTAKNNRGDLGYFSRDRMTPEFTDPVFAAKDGSIIGPIKTAFGYHIVKVLEHRPGTVPGYDEVELRVKNDLRQELSMQYVGKLKKTAKVTVDQKAVEKL